MKDAEQASPLEIYGVQIDPDMFAKYGDDLTPAQRSLLQLQIDLVCNEILTSVIDLHLGLLSDQVLLPQEKQHYRQHLIRLNQAYQRLSVNSHSAELVQSKKPLHPSSLNTNQGLLKRQRSDIPLPALVGSFLLYAFLILLLVGVWHSLRWLA